MWQVVKIIVVFWFPIAIHPKIIMLLTTPFASSRLKFGGAQISQLDNLWVLERSTEEISKAHRSGPRNDLHRKGRMKSVRSSGTLRRRINPNP